MTRPESTDRGRDPYPVDPDQLAICRQRGHEHSGRGITYGVGPTWGICKWCGARFRITEPEQVEHPDTPEIS